MSKLKVSLSVSSEIIGNLDKHVANIAKVDAKLKSQLVKAANGLAEDDHSNQLQTIDMVSG